MDIKELTIDYQTAVSTVIFVVSIVGFYWKLKIDMAKITLAIEEIKTDRAEKWKKQATLCFDRKSDYEKIANAQKEKDEKTEAYLADIAKGVNELKQTIEGIKKDVEWLKKDK